MSTVSTPTQRPKSNDTDDHIEQGWSGYHEELSSDPTFKFGLLVSHYFIYIYCLQDAYRDFRWSYHCHFPQLLPLAPFAAEFTNFSKLLTFP